MKPLTIATTPTIMPNIILIVVEKSEIFPDNVNDPSPLGETKQNPPTYPGIEDIDEPHPKSTVERESQELPIAPLESPF